MNILILCDMFPPAFAPRMGYLAKYLQRQGHRVKVISEYIDDKSFAFLSKDIDVTHIMLANRSSKFRWFLSFIINSLIGRKDAKMFAEACRAADDMGRLDVVLSGAYRTFPLRAALRVARKYQVPLVADHRDILEQYPNDEFISFPVRTVKAIDRIVAHIYKAHLIRQRNKVIRQAAAVTTASEWHVQQLIQHNPNTHLIYNGYDPELFFPERVKTQCFRLTYAGRIHSLSIRDPRPLFEAVAQLDSESLISEKTFCIDWYMDVESEEIIKPMAADYGIEKYMHYMGYVEANRIPRMFNESSVILQLANKADANGPKGIMSTKLFESLAVKKPLLCVKSDEACLAQTIAEANAGASARNAQEAKAFILSQYQSWRKNGYTEAQINEEYLSKFSRERQAEQFAELFNSLTQLKTQCTYT